jgi:hypothetical protein
VSQIKNKALSLIFLLISLSVMTVYSSNAVAGAYFATTAQATAAATKLGYSKTNELSNGQAVYMVTKASAIKGLTYITPDVDSHNGGAWKAASSVANLGSKRLGTYNENLTVRIGD